MKVPAIEAFLEDFERALKLSGRRRRRVLDEVRDHLIEATDSRIAGGLDPSVAETAAVEAFGDPVAVAARFDPGLVARARHRVTDVLDGFDRWHAVHPVASTGVLLMPAVLIFAVLWAPLIALCFAWPYATMVWIGAQLRDRKEPGYRHRMWAWKHDYPGKYRLASATGFVFAMGFALVVEFSSGLPHASPWLIPALAPWYPLLWILCMPRRYVPPPASAS